MKKFLKYFLVVIGVVALIPLSLWGLMAAGVDISPFFNYINTFQDKSKRPSPGATIEARFGEATVRINYSQPAKKNREVFGKLVPYGEVWRTGANEATSISLDKAINVAGKTLPAGKYQLFTIPRADKWTIIFNSKSDQWGAFFYDEKSDVLRVDVPSGSNDSTVERLILAFETMPETGLTIAWDKTKVFVPIKAQ